jgi:hypothetical protein
VMRPPSTVMETRWFLSVILSCSSRTTISCITSVLALDVADIPGDRRMDIETLIAIRRQLRQCRRRVSRRSVHHTRALLIGQQVHHMQMTFAGVKNLEGVFQDPTADRLNVAVSLFRILVNHADTTTRQDIVELA